MIRPDLGESSISLRKVAATGTIVPASANRGHVERDGSEHTGSRPRVVGAHTGRSRRSSVPQDKHSCPHGSELTANKADKAEKTGASTRPTQADSLWSSRAHQTSEGVNLCRVGFNPRQMSYLVGYSQRDSLC